MQITILGCGSSLGTPTLGFGWEACDPNEPKNRRTRPSILIQQDGFNLLVDTGVDMREQLLREQINHIDAVFYTHEHADHTHGVDDLRGFTLKTRKSIPIYGDLKTLGDMEKRFSYFFTHRPADGSATERKVGLTPNVIAPTGTVRIGPLTLQTFQQSHGYGTSLGLRIGKFAYSTDASYLSKAAFAVLDGIETWIVDCNNRKSGDSNKHSTFENTLDWIARVKPRRAILTHLPAWWDYAQFLAQCPNGVEPGYDGLKLIIDI